MMLYISFYFVLHEMTQIRAGVVSALFLLAVYHIAKKKKKSITADHSWLILPLFLLSSPTNTRVWQ